MFRAALTCVAQSAMQATVIHSFCLCWDAHQVHLRLQGKLFSVPPTKKHNVTVNVYDVMENKPSLHLIIQTKVIISIQG